MKSRIFRATVSVAIFMVISCIAVIMGVLYAYFDKQYTNELSQEAVYIARGVEMQGMDYLEGLNAKTHRITWIDSDGTVLYDSVADPAQMDNHSDRVEFKEAIESSVGRSIRYSNTLSEKTIYYALRLTDGSVIRVAATQYSIWIILVGMTRPILVVLFAAFIVSAIITYHVSKRIVKPLNEIDLEHPENAVSYNEITPLLKRIAHQNREISKNMGELKRQREEFSTITENMSEGFLVVDNLAKILSHNQSALNLLGIKGNVENKNVLELNRSESFCKAIDLALNGKHNEQMMKLDDKTYHLLANPVYQESNVIGAVIIILDVSEKEERESFRREFTANVSHELKTPLTTISGTAEIMKNGLIKPEDIPHFATNIYNEAQRLITLVGDILRLSKMDENNFSSEKVEVDLKSIAQRASQAVLEEAKKRNISVNLFTESCVISGIPSILEEIAFNLCDNAVKYNVDGGRVDISLTKDGDKAIFSVSDTGIGISYDEQERVFERFYRVDKSHSKEIGGTGLGLSIVKHGAAIHDAKIDMHSTLGKGTTVTITFKCVKKGKL